MIRYIIYFLSILYILSIAGCAPTKATFNSKTFADISNKDIVSIALVPFAGIETGRKELGKIDTTIIDSFKKGKIKTKYIGSLEAYQKLSGSEISEWNNIYRNDAISHDSAINLAAKIGKILKADAVIQGEVSNIVQHDAAYGEKFGDTKVTLKISMFSTATGKLLWTATSQGTVGTLTTNDPAPPVIDAVDVAVKEIFKNFPIK